MLWKEAKFGVMATTIDVKKYCRDQAIWENNSNQNVYNCSQLI